MTSRRGDVVLVRFPNSDLLTFKKRPALVIQAEGIETGLPPRIVAAITSNLRRVGPTRVSVPSGGRIGREMGLLSDSVVMTDNLATVLDREIDKTIGRCPAMEEVDAALKRTLGRTLPGDGRGRCGAEADPRAVGATPYLRRL